MVDYGWDLYSRQAVWSLRQACYIALLRIPEGYEEYEDIGKIENLFNASHVRGNNSIQSRTFPRTGSPCTIRLRKMRRRLGRLLELRIQLLRGRQDQSTMGLCRKLFGETVPLDRVSAEAKKMQDQVEEVERAQRYMNIRNWHQRIQGSMSVKGAWIHSKKGRKNLSLKKDWESHAE